MIVAYAHLVKADRVNLERLARFLKLRPEVVRGQAELAALVSWRIKRIRERAWRV